MKLDYQKGRWPRRPTRGRRRRARTPSLQELDARARTASTASRKRSSPGSSATRPRCAATSPSWPTRQGKPRTVALADMVRFYQPNAMGLAAKMSALCGQGVGIARRGAARIEHRRRPVPGHLRHRDADLPDGDGLLSLGRAGRHLSGRIRPGRRAGAPGADRREQSGRHPLDRLRHLRPGLLRLRHRRRCWTSGSFPSASPPAAHLRHRRHPLGQPDAGAADRAGGDRGHGGGDLRAIPRGIREGSLRPGRDQVPDAGAGAAADGLARHDDRLHPGHGPRRRRSGAR